MYVEVIDLPKRIRLLYVLLNTMLFIFWIFLGKIQFRLDKYNQIYLTTIKILKVLHASDVLSSILLYWTNSFRIFIPLIAANGILLLAYVTLLIYSKYLTLFIVFTLKIRRHIDVECFFADEKHTNLFLIFFFSSVIMFKMHILTLQLTSFKLITEETHQNMENQIKASKEHNKEILILNQCISICHEMEKKHLWIKCFDENLKFHIKIFNMYFKYIPIIIENIKIKSKVTDDENIANKFIFENKKEPKLYIERCIQKKLKKVDYMDKILKYLNNNFPSNNHSDTETENLKQSKLNTKDRESLLKCSKFFKTQEILKNIINSWSKGEYIDFEKEKEKQKFLFNAIDEINNDKNTLFIMEYKKMCDNVKIEMQKEKFSKLELENPFNECVLQGKIANSAHQYLQNEFKIYEDLNVKFQEIRNQLNKINFHLLPDED